jgi:hypothetical protein
MNTTRAAIDAPTTILTTVSDSLTAMRAPSAEVKNVIAPSGTSSDLRNIPARPNRAVAETVMKVTANMLVATA